MSTETDRLEKEAEAHRSDLDSTLDAIRGKLSIGQIVDEVSQHLTQGQGAETARNLGRQVRDNPLALGMIGAGFAWLLMGSGARAHGSDAAGRYERWRDDRRHDREDRRYDRFDEAFPPEHDEHGRSLGDRLGDAEHSVAGAAASARSSAGRAGESASNAGHAAADSFRRGLHDTRDAAGSGAQSVYRGARSSGRGMAHGSQRAADFLSEQPLVAGALALGVGLAIASAFPRTRQEDELFGEASDEMRERAMSEGRSALHKAEGVARASYEAASQEADQQGLKPRSGDEAKPLAERAAAVGRAAEEAGREEAKKQG